MNAPRGSKRASHMHESDDLHSSSASRPFLAWTRRQIELLALACPHLKDVRSSCFPPAAAPIGDLGQERKARRRAASAPRGARRPEKTRSVRRRRGGPMDRRDAGATSDGRLINQPPGICGPFHYPGTGPWVVCSFAGLERGRLIFTGQDQQDSEPDTDISSVFTGRLRLLGANEASSRTRDDGISRAERLVIRAAVCCWR